MQSSQTITVSVIWRGNKYVLEMDYSASLKELGHELQKLTNVIEDTMRLIVPRNKGSNLYSPFSDDHSSLSLQQVSIIEGKSIRMMGVTELEIDKVLQNEKADLRILGFDEEERRLRQRMLDKPSTSLKLPQGQYTFCDFRTLELPGVELNPPPSEALKRMHMLAADPGIVAIMNKHRWRVGIMTEMAPVGYVGVSPKCTLGFNKNHGEEISLRLRTDDLKGFRKYESIKKTLLHELAHMVYSEHDADFYTLDKQLNQEAATLDWSRSRGHTLSGVSHSHRYEENFSVEDTTKYSQKLGGDVSDKLASARASSVAAAYRRLANASANNNMELSQVNEEPDPDDSDHPDSVDKGITNVETPRKDEFEPDPDDSETEQKHLGYTNITMRENGYSPVIVIKGQEGNLNRSRKEPDPDDLKDVEKLEPISLDNRNFTTPENGHSLVTLVPEHEGNPGKSCKEPDPDESQANRIVKEEPDPDDDSVDPQSMKIDEPDPDDDSADPQSMKIDEPDPDDQDLRRIRDPVTVFYSRLQKAIEMLKAEVNSSETTVVFQTLIKIIRNVIEHPNELKYKRLRKANPIIQKNVANYKAATEILVLIGFNEDMVLDETGKSETYLVLKRNDPGLLWLTKSSLEPCIA